MILKFYFYINLFFYQSLQTTELLSEFEHVASSLPSRAHVINNDVLGRWES